MQYMDQKLHRAARATAKRFKAPVAVIIIWTADGKLLAAGHGDDDGQAASNVMAAVAHEACRKHMERAIQENDAKHAQGDPQ